jgi:SAM-dependent methyltransferase
MKTDYFSHDAGYRWLRSNGKTGWSETDEAYDEQKSHIQETLGRLCLPVGSTILELGCGAGNITVWLARFGYNVTGIDISPTAIDWARCRAVDEGVDAAFFVGDVLDLSGIEDNNFDLVFDGHCFHCIIGDDRLRFLSEAYRVVKPGGYFFADSMCQPVKAEAIKGYDERSRCSFRGDAAARYFGLPDDITAEIITAGFRIIRYAVETEEPNSNIVIEAIKDER